ncbi:GNAT family N-acetyltransferase [Xenorhabdus szentirmaii]|uniref:Acetyltransferase n=1 Tax=Xenorhabdus szentirmaii DSM 16338 TaxID=1427518 RepID=W1IRW1_9GAMM|nr:GNAT family N-acetyltransferase [Xenorhabdus szentirmaii]PHM32576.1 GNAT family N-acetyltransferase [Xenorhabdus szentirmaii DSM 16338]PHM41116.1 GNAT family N-acetyltransferase [Xenorhabdus szentirmaii]CDL80568.1 putative acetyltransferase [Xenorhabdus szentirmaii DSM 16338]
MKSSDTLNCDEIHIRTSIITELSTLADLRWALCSDDGKTEQPIDKAHFTELFLKKTIELDSMGNLINVVAEKNAELIGVISLILVNKIPSPYEINGCWGYVTNVYVKPTYRNHGVGKRLLNFVKEQAVANKCELLIVWPSDRSYPFYKRAGFKSEEREQDPLVLVP